MDFINMEVQKYWSIPSSYTEAKKKETINNALWSGEYVASEKKDGYFEMVHKDNTGKTFMRARSKGVNGWIFKQDWVPHLQPFFDSLPNNTTLLTEVYLEGMTSRKITTILGSKVDKAIDRQKDNPLKMWVFDVLQYNGIDLYNLPMSERVGYLNSLNVNFDYVDKARYWFEPSDIHDNWLNILDKGGEGVVLTRKDYPYEPKKRKARATLKLKKELADNVDVFLTGVAKEPTKLYTGKDPDNWQYWYNEVTGERVLNAPRERAVMDFLIPVTRLWYYNMAGAVEIAMYINGKPTPVGWISGIDDSVRSEIMTNPEKYKGKVVELQAMEVNEENGVPAFRHGKILQWRDDKRPEDCDWISGGK